MHKKLNRKSLMSNLSMRKTHTIPFQEYHFYTDYTNELIVVPFQLHAHVYVFVNHNNRYIILINMLESIHNLAAFLIHLDMFALRPLNNRYHLDLRENDNM